MTPSPNPASSAPASLATPAAPYYQRHIFFCLNERSNNEACCATHQAKEAYGHCKALVKAAGIAKEGQVRVNQAGCLNRCAGGPVAVVYPEGTWYSYVDLHDVEEIVEAHLKNGKVVQRLLTPAHLGR